MYNHRMDLLPNRKISIQAATTLILFIPRIVSGWVDTSDAVVRCKQDGWIVSPKAKWVR